MEITLIPAPPAEHAEAREQDKVERLCLDFDEDCVLGDCPPFGSFRKCRDYDRGTGFCPFCLPRD
jgi:hypothetical protein